MNAELAEIALVTPEMSWSSYFDAATLRAFSEGMRNLRGTTCFGLQQSPLTARAGSKEQRLVFGHNVYGMFDDALYGQYLGSIIYHWISPSPRSNCPCLSGPQPALSCWIRMARRFRLIAAMSSTNRSRNRGLPPATGLGLWALVKLKII